jgi:hypothetical protein
MPEFITLVNLLSTYYLVVSQINGDE